MAKEETTITPDKINMLKDYDTMVQRVAMASKKELETLTAQRENLILKNSELERELTRKQSEFEQWKRLETMKFDEVRRKTNNEIIKKEKELEVGELDISRRIEEIAKREKLGIAIVAKEAKLNNDRIEIEKLRSKISLMEENANRTLSDAMSKHHEATLREEKAKKILADSNTLNEVIVKREQKLKELERDSSESLKNMQEVKAIIDPKIKELNVLQETLDKSKKAVEAKEQAIANKSSECNIIMKDLEAREKKIKEREKQLDQKDAEITRKALLAGAKKDN